MSIQRVGTENLPNIYVKEVEMWATSNRVCVSPLLYLYDLRGSGGNLQWYSDQTIKQNMKILVVVSASETLNRGITDGNVAFTPKHIRKAAGYSKQHVKYKVLSIPTANRETFKAQEGGLFTFPYKCGRIWIPKSENVSVFAATFLDVPQFSSENALDLSSLRLQSYHGAVVGEAVLRDGSVPTVSDLFLRQRSRNPYAGPVTRYGNTYLAGSRRSQVRQIRLRKTKVTNAKIKDYRFSFKRKRRNRMGQRGAFISELMPSIDRNGNLRASFTLDMEEILLRKSEYGYMLKSLDKDLFKALLSEMKILNLTVYKQQIVESISTSRVGTKKTKSKPVGNPKVVVSSKDVGGRLRRRKKYTNNMAQNRATVENLENDSPTSALVLMASLREVLDSESENKNIRTIVFQDNEGTFNPRSKYRYFIEIDFKDPAEPYLEKVYRDMQRSVSVFKNYKKRVLRRSNYDTHLQTTKPNLYDNTPTDIWDSILRNFLGLYSMFFTVPEDKQALYNKLALLIHPKTATSNSIELFEDRYNYVCSYFRKYFKVNKTDLVPKIKLGAVRPDDGKGVIKFSNKFQTTIDFEKWKSSISFIPKSILPPIAITTEFPVVSFGDIRSMATNERAKYFKDPPAFTPDSIPSLPGDLLNSLNNIRYNSYTYFSPSSLTVNKNDTVDLSRIENIDMLEFNSFYVNSLRNTKSSFMFEGNRRSEEINRGNESSFYVRRKRREVEKEEDYESAHHVIGKDSAFPSAVKEETKIGESSEDRATNDRFRSYEQLKERQSPHMSDYHLLNRSNVLMSIAVSNKSNAKKKRDIRSIPLQVKALIASPYGFARNNMFYSSKDLLRDSLSRNLTNMMFLSVVKIEYLRGFHRGDVRRPIWEELTEYNFFRTIRKNRESVLCRFVPYDDSAIKLDSNYLNSVGIENEYFYVSPRRGLQAPRRRRPLGEIKSIFNDVTPDELSDITKVDQTLARTIIIQQPAGKTGALRSVDFSADNRTRRQEGDVASAAPTVGGGNY